MLAILLSLLGIGGAGGLAAFFFPGLIPAAVALFKRIPPKVLLYIAIAAAVVGAFLWHQAHAHNALKKADATGYARAMTEVRDRALKLKAKTDALTAEIAAKERKRNNEENHRIERSADAQRLRGPGRAVCPFPATPAGRYLPTAGTGNAAVAEVPDRAGVDLIGLPFSDTIDFGKDHDLDRAEVASWRRWYDALVKAWPKSGPLPK